MTLALIAVNVYSAVLGPTSRGFSFIEIWMVGVNVPILVGILEYGFLLAMKKYQRNFRIKPFCRKNSKILQNNLLESVNILLESVNMDALSLKVDKYAFLFSITFVLCFNLMYWTAALC